jgi:hypothetical protein
MATKRKRAAERGTSNPAPKTDHPVERDPAVERGERIATSKDIARGGKKQGFVPGASEQPKK